MRSKTSNDNYYLLTMAAIAQEIREELAGVSISSSRESVSKKQEIPSQMRRTASGAVIYALICRITLNCIYSV